MNKRVNIYTSIILLIGLFYSDSYGYSLKTVYEDAANADPETFIIALAFALVAYPILLLACRLKLGKPTNCTQLEYLKTCFRVSAKQLLPLLFLIYVAAFFIMLIVSIVFVVTVNILFIAKIEIKFFQNINSLYFVLKIMYLCWYIYSIFLAVKWLPKRIEDEMTI